MSRKWNITASLIMMITAVFFVGTVSGQIYSRRVSDNQVRTLLTRIENRTDVFSRNVQTALDRSTLNNTNREDRIIDFVRDFESSTDTLKSRFNSRQSADAEVNDVLSKAVNVDQFIRRNRLTNQVYSQWQNIKRDLNTLARYNNVSWNWNTLPVYPDFPGDNNSMDRSDTRLYSRRVSDNQVRTLLTRIENRTDVFSRNVQTALDRSTLNNTNREDRIIDFVRDFESSTDTLKSRFNSRQSADAEVNDVLSKAVNVDQFIRRNRLTNQVYSQWQNIKRDLNTLARYNNVSWNWNTLPVYPDFPGDNNSMDRFDTRLTGTYRINSGQSDNVSQVVERSTSGYATAERDRMRQNLERRLGSPEMMAIEKDGRNMTIASTLAPQISIDIDGVARSETNNRGRTIRTTARETNSTVIISYEGDRTNDFYLTFTPIGRDQLRITRRLFLENVNKDLTVTSVYDKVNNVAQWSTVSPGGSGNNNTGGNYGDFYIPNGTRLTATLRNQINTTATQVGDRFTLDVTSPARYLGATIEGRVTNADNSGRVSGRANISFDFDTLQMNGRTYRFAGIIDSVRTPNGNNVSVSNEGTVRDSNQTTKTVTRAGIGAALGALIGAIAGGGQGAAIGAAVGAGAGAGTVLIQGRDNVTLDNGTEFTITSTGPNTVGRNY
ncbi:MAG: hypothetical protein ABI539_01515 [Acidobacteriota bacterium]